MGKHYLLAIMMTAALCAGARSQTPALYDDFSGSTLDSARWGIINENGAALADVSTTDGALTVTGRNNRTGPASLQRVGTKCVVEATALGWTGTNQILQLYGGSGTDFTNFLEFGLEGTEANGTPIAHVWTPTAESFRGASPVPGTVSPANPSVLRIERDGTAWRFLINGNLVHSLTGAPVPGDARVVLYGWQSSVTRWDDIGMTGPQTMILSPTNGEAVTRNVDVIGETGPDTAAWTLDTGNGANPTEWKTLAQGTGQASGVLTHWRALQTPASEVTFRLRATDSAGHSRSEYTTVRPTAPGILMPMAGQVVGPAFTVVVERAETAHVRAVFTMDGQIIGESQRKPFSLRIVTQSDDDGPRTLGATLYTAENTPTVLPDVNVTVQRNLYGSNARVADNGKGFVFPDGSVGIAVGENDGYPWPGLDRLWLYGDIQYAEDYVKDLRAHGVNVMRIMMEYAENTSMLLENPLGSYNAAVVTFWDRFFPMCERNGMTVLVTPWDTFWMNQPWSNSPYNAINGGPCQTVRDFITKPEARAWQKARLRYIINRYGNSKAIFATDLLNEFDIWWDATPEERADWLNEMAVYVESYERQKWGKRHMLTVSSAAAQPNGVIGEIVYRYPLFEFSNTHQYYGGTVNDPQNLIDPALSVNGGVKYSLTESWDHRPYTDTESGPIDKWIADETWDNLYFRFMAWAHIASGGTGTGMRWPYRTPHYLTSGMHDAQFAVSTVSRALDWLVFQPENADARLSINKTGMITMGCADAQQGVAWVAQDVRSTPAHSVSGAILTMNGLLDGRYIVTCWDPTNGAVLSRTDRQPSGGALAMPLPTFPLDVAVTARRVPNGDLNADFLVDMSDATSALRITGGLADVDSAKAMVGDMNGDGVMDLSDATTIARIAAGA